MNALLQMLPRSAVKVTPDKAVAALSRFGGTVLKSSLSNDAQNQLQEALHEETPAAA